MTLSRKQTRSQSKLPGAQPLHPGLGRSKIILRNRTRHAADAIISPQTRVELGTPVSTPSTGGYEENTEEDDPEEDDPEEDDPEAEDSTSAFPDFSFMPDYVLAEPSELTASQAMEVPETQIDAIFQLATSSVDFSSPSFCTHRGDPLGSPTRGAKRKERDFLSSADESGTGLSSYAGSNHSSESLSHQTGSPLPKRIRELKESLDFATDDAQLESFGPVCLGYPFCMHWPNLHLSFTYLSADSADPADIPSSYSGQRSDSDMGYFPRGHLSEEP